MPKSRESKELRATPRGRAVTTFIGSALIAGALFGVADLTKGGDLRKKDQIIAVKGADRVQGNIIVLKSGAVYRATPIDLSDANNRIGRVPKGKELVIDTPLITSQPDTYTLDEAGWAAFTKPGTDTDSINSLDDRAAVTVYADLAKLEAEGKATVYPDHQAVGDTAGAHVAANGSIMINRPKEFVNTAMLPDGKMTTLPAVEVDPYAATSFLEPAGDFKQIFKPER